MFVFDKKLLNASNSVFIIVNNTRVEIPQCSNDKDKTKGNNLISMFLNEALHRPAVKYTLAS